MSKIDECRKAVDMGHFELFSTRRFGRKQWRWHFVHKGYIIYGTTESYRNKQDCIDTIPQLSWQHTREWRELL